MPIPFRCPGIILAPVLLTAAMLHLPAQSAHAQEGRTAVTISGHVIARNSGDPLEDATVELTDRGRVLTNSEGAFRFVRVPAGRAIITVRAFGYENAELTLLVNRDTSVVITLIEAPIALDSIAVMTRRITVKGRITGKLEGVGVVDARVGVAPGDKHTTTSGTGRYTIRNVGVGDSSFVGVEAFGYLPARKYLTTLNDTTVDFVLKVDPIAERMIERQIQRLVTRSDTAVPYRIERIRREDMHHNGSIQHVLATQYRLRGASCVVIDDVYQIQSWAKRRLLTMPSDEVAFIEIIDRKSPTKVAAGMLRIYTKDYVRRMVIERPVLKNIVVYRQGPSELCR